MADVHWIKLDTGIFDNPKIKYLRKIAGAEGVLIWIQLLTMAGRCNDGGSVYLTSSIPYTNEMLADELHFSESVVAETLQRLEDLDMIFYSEDGFITISDWEEHQNIDGMEKIREQARLRKQRYNEKKRARSLDNVVERSENVPGNVTVTCGNATDIEIETEKTRKEKPTGDSPFERFWQAYPNKKGKDAAEKSFKRIKGVPVEEMIAAVEKQKQSDQWTKEYGRFIPYPATWLNQGRWKDEVEVTAPEYKITDLPTSISRFG